MTSVKTQADTRHVVVIGAGTVGSSCAWNLKKAGFDVTVIDPELPGQTTSYGNAGIISTSHITPFSYPGVTSEIPGWLFDPTGPLFIRWLDFPGFIPWFWKFWRSGTNKHVNWSCRAQARLMHHAVSDFDEILADTNSSHMRKERGTITFYDSRAEFDKDAWKYDIKDELGFEWELLSPSELSIMVPDLDIKGGVAVYNPGWQFILDPGKTTAMIAQACFAAGGNWIQDRVTRVETSDQGVSLVTESGRQITADVLVVAAGVWSNQIARQLDYKVPLAPKRGYHSMIADAGIKLDYPVMSVSRAIVMTPMNDGLRISGTAEFAALDAEPNYDRAKILLRHAQEYLPGLRCNDVSEWLGQRPMMADSIPVISPSPSRTNVFYAFGHGHYGLTQGPTTGKIITAMVLGQEPAMDVSDYRFDRFS